MEKEKKEKEKKEEKEGRCNKGNIRRNV